MATKIGTSDDDIINGTEGSDKIFGLLGNDTIMGLGGDDFIVGGGGQEKIDAGSGNDVVFAQTPFTLNPSASELFPQPFSGFGAQVTGGDGDDILAGEATFDAGAGNDVLIGGYVGSLAGAGDDILIDTFGDGGPGNDTYILTRSGGAGALVGFDTGTNRFIIDRMSEGSAALAVHAGDVVEFHDVAGINSVADILSRSLTVTGGIVVQVSAFMSVTIAFGAGVAPPTFEVNKTDVDRIYASINTRINSANPPSVGDDYLFGDSADNTINGLQGNDHVEGFDGNDILDGGAGDDTLVGGAGDDTYLVDSAGDVVTELWGEGTDTIQSTVSYTLADNVENLTLTGAGNINGTGNTLANVLTGNTGNNILDGKAGADTMKGGAGDDTYVVDNAGDVVSELAGQGTDTVQSTISYTLADTVENLVLSGAGAINGTGNALANLLTGNTGNNVLDGKAGADTMKGGAGDDIYIVDTAGDVVSELANEGTDTVQSTVSYTLSDNVERLTLTGTGNFNGSGNALANLLTGNTGNNVLDGKGGADTMRGGAGNDIYLVDNTGDMVSELANEGTDTVQSAVSYTLSDNVENLTLTGTGNLNGTGNTLANVLTGNTGNNILDGKAGADTMAGGAGDDTYVVDNAGDVVSELAGQGTDTVQSTIGYTLTDTVENLTLTGTGNINGTGNALANLLTGNTGNNILDGKAGADTMAGGFGNDTYIVDDAGDVVTELAGPGTDTVQSMISYTLTDNVENLVLSGAGNLNGTGNALANVLTGNAGNNILDGKAGADTMKGGAGNDTYLVDSVGDVVSELANEGTDIVQSTVSYTLSDNVENLVLTGSANINGTGNTLANLLTGNTGNNILDGKAGADTMAGGAGDDTYLVDDAGDAVSEAAGQGTDTVNSSVTYTLGNNVETLVLTGSASLDGTGNNLANVLTGNAGNNVLDGKAGADTMKGGAGNDTYLVDNAGDVVSELAGQGTDAVQSTVSYTLSDNVENLVLVGIGNLTGTGNTLANLLTGNTGSNGLDGKAGADTMKGGAGNDTYLVDNAGDVVIELANEGTDIVQSTVSYTLTENVERLTLVGAGNVNGTGNALANLLTGSTGNNVLDGKGGADTMKGGAGNDTYLVDNAGDVVIELANEGTDTVQSTVTYTLASNVENLVLVGAGNVNGTGNALANLLTGNAGNNVLDGKAAADTMKGGAGDDTYLVDDAGDVVTEAAGQGTDTVKSSITCTLANNVENLVLTGSANLNGTGNTLANLLTGNAGNNTLDGKAGADTMKGGAGDDTYLVDNAGDVVIELAGQGTDIVNSSVTYTLANNVENLVLTGSASLNGTGNNLANVLTGNTGSNVLDGKGGADTMAGGAGNDTYLVDNAGDVVSELAGQGTDTVQSTISYTLTDTVENLVLSGAGNLNGTGNALANVLTGNTGNNVLDGKGGADTMKGGAGNDIYIVDNAGDVVSELANEGTDTVQSTVTYTLANDVENLTLTGSANINGTGNALANVLTGNAGNNVLDGKAGADIMKGGAGDDTYLVDNAGDVVIELADQGTDTVNSSVTCTLANGVENLVLTGSASLNGTGNNLANLLTGNAGNNVLDGKGGADTMKGGAGNDTYLVDNAGDVVSELAGQGTDTVQSTVSYTLSGNVENLILSGAGNVSGTGNTLANLLTGNTGNNVLDGKESADVLTGGGGSDTFAFTTPLVAGNVDTITDFSVADDTIRLSHTIFNTIAGTGTLSAAQFVANASGTAQDANHRIIYETDTGKLFFDSNGSAAGGATQFAAVAPGLALTNANFSVL